VDSWARFSGGLAYSRYGGAGLWFGVGCVNFVLCAILVVKIVVWDRGWGARRGWARLGTDEGA
jgi:hypothetical protein